MASGHTPQSTSIHTNSPAFQGNRQARPLFFKRRISRGPAIRSTFPIFCRSLATTAHHIGFPSVVNAMDVRRFTIYLGGQVDLFVPCAKASPRGGGLGVVSTLDMGWLGGGHIKENATIFHDHSLHVACPDLRVYLHCRRALCLERVGCTHTERKRRHRDVRKLSDQTRICRSPQRKFAGHWWDIAKSDTQNQGLHFVTSKRSIHLLTNSLAWIDPFPGKRSTLSS